MKQNTFFENILCSFGFHKWGKRFGYDQYSSNVIDWNKKCERCGKIEHWVEAKIR